MLLAHLYEMEHHELVLTLIQKELERNPMHWIRINGKYGDNAKVFGWITEVKPGFRIKKIPGQTGHAVKASRQSGLIFMVVPATLGGSTATIRLFFKPEELEEYTLIPATARGWEGKEFTKA